ncbi:MAG: hypothetical protein IKV99_03760 [Oscillospiraceae bacterium]|nr:hypothetical protein [Oscillospiraceae bacterium]
MIERNDAFVARAARVKTAIALGTPDRVPFVPTMGNLVALEYGASVKEAMTDQSTIIPALDRLLEDIKPDYFYTPDFFPKNTLDILRPININYPGKTPEFGDNFTYQVADHTFMEDDEYDVFLKDPSAFLMHRVLAEKYEALAGLKLLNPYNLCGATVMGFASLAAPPLVGALEAMLAAGKATQAYIGSSVAVNMHLIRKGFPIWGSAVASAPFDIFADNIRGLLNTVMDLKTDPELLAQALDRFTDVVIADAIALAKMSHSDSVFVPLHIGVDEFMSPSDYEQYYWPSLKKLLCALVAADLTPFVFCEGNYYTRLNCIKDVPKGKIVYLFEKQDMAKAKRELEGIACVAGNMSTATLMHGSTEQVVTETRRLLDTCAPGGGYIMSNDISLDNCKRENLAAWYEAVEKYGSY